MARKGKGKRASQGQEDLLGGMKEWRKAHCRASYVEIETEMEARIQRLRAQMMAEIVGMSQAADWKAGGQVLHCPECGEEMEGGGKHRRHLQGAGGSEVELEREYAHCPACGAGFFPSG
ncbi:MAG: hypothetical protein IH586_08030 [Anaerolineaceae bacterium]|nr:hypothetical protein [Anaerolineaceae bacterium]